MVVGAGGVLVELLADRVVALPPVGPGGPATVGGCGWRLLAGVRGQPAADLDAVVAAITGCPSSPASSATSSKRWTSTR